MEIFAASEYLTAAWGGYVRNSIYNDIGVDDAWEHHRIRGEVPRRKSVRTGLSPFIFLQPIIDYQTISIVDGRREGVNIYAFPGNYSRRPQRGASWKTRAAPSRFKKRLSSRRISWLTKVAVYASRILAS